ncbi:MAG: hypothetical protein HYR71_00290 [Chloroflexi bacterium]|nr:hypothetical protein [Chloroflexota bacterium]
MAGWRLGINPFDQPNVESAKVLTRQILAASRGEAALPSPIPGRGVEGEAAPAVRSGDIAVYGAVQAETPGDALKAFLEPIALPSPILGRGAGGEALRPYVALQAYIQPTPETDAALYALRARIQSGWRVATTVGYGPRFLHSTGQLHKGDGGHGFFIQFTADMPRDAAIPDDASAPASSISFGVLKTAQVLGDGQALTNRGRRVIRFHLGADAPGALRQLADDLV